MTDTGLNKINKLGILLCYVLAVAFSAAVWKFAENSFGYAFLPPVIG
jgi:hypothetical protein